MAPFVSWEVFRSSATPQQRALGDSPLSSAPTQVCWQPSARAAEPGGVIGYELHTRWAWLVWLGFTVLGCWAVVVGSGTAAIVLLAALVPYLLLRGRARPRLALDEGGLRWDGVFGLSHHYFAFTEIRRASLVDGSRLLIQGPAGERSASFRFSASTGALSVHAELGQRLATGRQAGASTLGRRRRDLGTWLATLTELASDAKRSPYRTRFDLEALARMAADVDLPIDVRAGATYVVLASGRAIGSSAAASPSAPPLMVALAALAPGGSELRTRARSLVPYLNRTDRDEWRHIAASQRNRGRP